MQFPVLVDVLCVTIASLNVQGPNTSPSPVLPTVIVAAVAQGAANALTTPTVRHVLENLLSGGMANRLEDN